MSTLWIARGCPRCGYCPHELVAPLRGRTVFVRCSACEVRWIARRDEIVRRP